MVFDHFLQREVLTTSATLIVAPSTLLDQWLSELNRHAPSLKVMFYPGIRKLSKSKEGTEISAEQLAEQDVVITTYEVLRTEIWAASDAPGRSMRNEQQYERLRSPLVQLSWWRVCIDEAQMVENWTNNAAKLARMIPRINAWGVTDLRGLLLFLRYEPYASDTKIWNVLTTVDKASFRKIFNQISMRHSKSLVRSEIAIPAQKRFVVSMPFTAVEEQHYQTLFEELAETCGLDARGNPLQADWDPEDPTVQSAMRVALDRLRQTVLHPEVGNRSGRALGKRAGPMRTVAEVLDAMLEQSDAAMRADQRSLLSATLTRGQILACQKRVVDALAVWQEALGKTTAMVEECRAQLAREIEEVKKGSMNETRSPSGDDEVEEVDDAVSVRVGEARRRLRSALEIQHRAVFFCANAHFSMKSNEEITVPGSEEFKRLERLEVEGYERAKQIRREILHEPYSKAKELMGRLARAAAEQAFVVIPEFKPVEKLGIESRRIADALEELGAALDEQAAEIDDWREHVIQLLLKPLVDEEMDDITGDEYEESKKLQEEILVYLQVLRTAIADRHAAITGQRNFLVEHETKTAARLAMEGQGPCPEKLLELLKLQVVSDMVGDYEGSLEDAALDTALQTIQRQEAGLEVKLAAAEAKHRYLKHLKDAESHSEEQQLCVICQSTFTIGVLTVCGHQFCKECIRSWFHAHRNCPVCKRHLHQSHLHDVTLKPQALRVHSEAHAGGSDGSTTSPASAAKKSLAIYKDLNAEQLAEIQNIDLDGPSYTTKVDTLTRHLLWLRESDPGAKSIVFSQYKEFLDILAQAFRRYRIGFTSFDNAHGVAQFKEEAGIEVFLLHARAHASGLNLVNASHVFLCEPLLNTALELQAIARVDRIGQQHETTVWLYIVDGTVEESIYDLSVQRRMEHMARNSKGKSRDSTPELSDVNLDEANAREMQQAHLSKLMGRDGISGEAVDKDDLWTCLFGNLQAKQEREERAPRNDATRRFLAAEAAEMRALEGRDGTGE
ncbi:c4c1990a-724a-49be-92d0-f7bf28fa9aea [Thermothielavioides terrestris]|uniref:C4c1990a-724a-49be-92d0-f7bf28fa9aea n=1 Tax=Thermothielavioides terrestris TaxID=2587410 RepID=A0A3S4C4H7_9PEZI|nr:c4c1990a-724a-49be-92d0-f7bf28fa9aea [Thermothielavioides terrestris]